MSTPIVAILLALTAAQIHADVVIHAVGDVMPGAAVPSKGKRGAVPADLFATIPQLRGSDLLFGNFEGAVADDPTLAEPCDGDPGTCYRFLMPSEAVRVVSQAGFKVVNIGNNHAKDAGPGSITRTIRAIENKSGICATGVPSRKICFVTSQSGPTIAVVGFSPHDGSTRAERENVIATVQEARQYAQIVMVSFHIGAEGLTAQHVTRQEEFFLGDSRGNVYDLAHAAVDAGADLVVGHGPHVLRAMELYRGRLIVYSMGNFATNGTFSTEGNLRYGALLQITLANDGALKSCRVVSTIQNRVGAAPRIITPALDPERHAFQLIQKLTAEDFPEGRLLFNGLDQVTPQLAELEEPPDPPDDLI